MKRLILALSFLFLVPATTPTLAFSANPLDPACKTAPQSSACQDSAAQTTSDSNPVVTTIAKVTKIFSLLVGIASVLLVIASGLTLIVSSGNAEAVKSAKSRLVGAVAGLVIASSAWLIVSFVVNRLL